MKMYTYLSMLVISAAIPGAAMALTDGQRDAYVSYLMAQNENPLKDCAVVALQLNAGLTAKLIAKASDQSIEKDLLSNISDAGFKAEREKEVAAWKKSKNPGQIALMNFNYCVQLKKVKADLGALGKACFNLTGVPALAEVLKKAGKPKEFADEKVIGAYGKQLSESFIRDAVGDVYAKNAEKDAYEAHRRVLAQCIKTMELAPISDEVLRKEYERFKAAIGDKEYNVSHIMVWTKEAAEKIVERLKNGESFAALANSLSMDTGSAGKGGDLGWNPPTAFAPAFADAVKKITPGTYTLEPVHTSFGWHVIKVAEVRPARVPAFEEVKESIRTSMQAKQMK
ncbi:MAG: peptidylprolyl isomerase [Burkholderiales bacterium]|nr:peptidylprolyl isomerase [Burkholderiales bacterium]